MKQLGVKYSQDGTSVSGVFENEALQQEVLVRNQVTGFMGIGAEGQSHTGTSKNSCFN